MHVKRVVIEGYRSLQNVEITFEPGKNILVGKNNAGKSNIVKALDIVLGERYPTYANVSPDDFYTSSKEQVGSLYILCELCGDDCDFESLTSLRGVWSTTSDYCVMPFSESQESGLAVDEVFFDADQLNGSYRDGEKRYCKGKALDTLVASMKRATSYFIVFSATRSDRQPDEVDKDFRLFYRDTQNGEWFVLWGLSKEFRDAFLTSAVLPAFRDPTSQLRTGEWSWYGKLLSRTTIHDTI